MSCHLASYAIPSDYPLASLQFTTLALTFFILNAHVHTWQHGLQHMQLHI